MAHTLPELPYPHNALEPHVDEATMRIHHGKHHAAYVTNLNKALEGNPMADKSIEDLMTGMDMANICLLYTSPSPRDRTRSRMPSSA